MRVDLDGVPHMSANCWAAVEDAVRKHPCCRYLEWGSGNSTLALLRSALAEDSSGLNIVSIENDADFANAMCGAIFETLERAHAKTVISVEQISFPRPTVLQALRKDPSATLYEANFLRTLWYTRNDNFWIGSLHRDRFSGRWTGAAERYVLWLACSTASRWERLQRSLAPPDRGGGPQVVERVGPDSSFVLTPLSAPTRILFDSGQLQLDYLFLPNLRNRLWHRPSMLDGSYLQLEQYVSVPLRGQFDVILVDCRARASCLKRVHHEGLLASGGVLFLHDAHRPSYLEALQIFGSWSFIRGSESASERVPDEFPPEGAPSPAPPLLRSGSSMTQLESVYDRELFFYEAPSSGPV